MNFSEIAARYENTSIVQKSAADILLSLITISENDNVLDVGCGTGNITQSIRKLTKGKVVGIDASSAMIDEAKINSKGLDIEFKTATAEEIDFAERFDVVFCNSAFQWFKDPQKAVKRFYDALAKGGRVAIQAPAKNGYCPNFIKTINAVRQNENTKEVFKYFRNPWFFLENSDEYKMLFENAGFQVNFSRIDCTKSKHTPEEVFKIFSSGAIAGYLNQDYYDVSIDDAYERNFNEIIKNAFQLQASSDRLVELVFNRIFLIAIKI